MESVTYPSDEVKTVLERTLGVPIFQEQVMQLAIVTAGFTPGEADRLRRAMAAWHRKGGLESFQERLISGMQARGYTAEFAKQIFQQIRGFGEYGFPESHSASFALLVYVSAWLKCHEPAAFTCALLNSQPMGFYAPAQLIADARRHGVEVRPADVMVSEWECALEAGRNEAEPALRLGLCMIKSLAQTAAQKIVAARAIKAFANVADLAHRAELNRRDLEALAASNALAALSGSRYEARWDILGIEPELPLFAARTIDEPRPALPVATEGEEIVADYASLGLTLGRHPLALLRNRLTKQRMISAADIRTLPDGKLVRTTGLVTCRQRPGTASGVTFVTLEDETGMINVIVWPKLAERQRRELLASSLLGVYGVLQRAGDVIHVIAAKLENQSPLLGRLVARSRDFH
jgi:error-prone DNA polymerase